MNTDASLSTILLTIAFAVGTGLLTRFVAWFLAERKQASTNRAWTMLAIGVGLLAGVALFVIRSDLRTVPNLARMSRAEAEQVLRDRGFVPAPRPLADRNTEEGRVVPESQRPIAGQPAEAGSIVSFAVSTGEVAVSVPRRSAPVDSVSSLGFSEPQSGASLVFVPDAGGIFRAAVAGGVPSSIDSTSSLLLWVRPVRPASESPGWYLQRGPIGVTSFSAGGNWEGVVQLGDREYPPGDGDVFDIAVSIAHERDAAPLLTERGVVIRSSPVGYLVSTVRNVRVGLR